MTGYRTPEAEAARLAAAAQALAADGRQRYTDAYTAATAGGWATSDLTALGFLAATTTASRRRAHRADPDGLTTHPTPAGSVPEQPSPGDESAAEPPTSTSH